MSGMDGPPPQQTPATSSSETTNATNANNSGFFEGSIEDAISIAKETNMMLIVAVQGSDNYSNKMDRELWTNSKVIAALSESVALKLILESEHGRNFTSIFPVFTTPTLYFIDAGTGQALKMLHGFSDVDEFFKGFNEAMQVHNKSIAMQQKDQTSSTPLSLEEQKQKLQERLADVRRKKEEAAIQEEQRKETERRKSGKDAQDTLRKIQEQKRQRELDLQKKEKREEELARKKIKEQIEKDKLERQKKKEKIEGQSPSISTTNSTSTPSSIMSSQTTIAFRLLDGTTIKKQFEASDTLQMAKSFIEQNYHYNKRFFLMTNVPRHVFTDPELNKTLRELGLVPNATVILSSMDDSGNANPSTNISHSSQTQNSPRYVPSFLDPIYALWTGITNYIWSFWTPSSTQTSSQPQSQTDSYRQIRSSESNNTVTRRTSNAPTTIHRIQATDFDDDTHNKTWNGNSTQQQ